MSSENNRLVWAFNMREIKDGIFEAPDGQVRLENGVVGEPRSTECYSVAQLKAMRIKGVYRVEGDEIRTVPCGEPSGDRLLTVLNRLFELRDPRPEPR